MCRSICSIHNAIVIVVFGAMVAGTAMATTGNDLMKACQGDKISGVGADAFCDGYIQGAADLGGARIGSKTVFELNKTCIPTGVTYAQVRAITVKYISDHPEDLHYQSASLVLFALHQAFPCAKQ